MVRKKAQKNDREQEADFEGYGFNGVIPKPHERAQLRQIVHAVIRQKGDGIPA